MERTYYCKRCGNWGTVFKYIDKCPRCGYKVDDIPQELASVWMYPQYMQECEKFIEDNIKSAPEFDEELYERLEKETWERIARENADYEKLKSNYERTHPECPYCHSRNTKKLSGFGIGISIGLLGLGSSKVGKQWHCNDCRSNF